MNNLLKTILNGLKTSFDSELKRVKKAVSEALNTANTAASSVDGKMDAEDPVGSGSFSMNRVKDSVVGNYSHAEGFRCTASGISSHAEGRSSNAEGSCSHAEGSSCTASGEDSHAEGSLCTASGDDSHAEGRETEASGIYSHAEGSRCAASGISSHAEGFGCTASGDESHAEGRETKASGDYSHAEGANTIAASDYQHVEGKDNIEDGEGKYIHIVGNGVLLNNKSNAHTIDWNGLGWFAGGLKVGGTGQDDETAEEVALKTDIPEIPSLEPYALKTEIPSLDNYALKSDIKSGIYSQTEQQIGTWINGKPIYRKTLVYEKNPLPANKWAYYDGNDLEGLHIDQYTNVSGICLCYSTNDANTPVWQPIPRVVPDAMTAYSIGFGDLNSSQVGVLFGTNYTRATIYLTIEYTKTTDTATIEI